MHLKVMQEVIKVEIVSSKDPLVQLEASKSSIKNLFKDLLIEMKGFKYQITMTVSLYKHKMDGNIKYSTVYFNFCLYSINRKYLY